MTLQVSNVEPDLQTLLRHSEVSELRTIELARVGNQVVLRGIVGSYYHKQLAQEFVKTRVGGLEVENQLCVEYTDSALTIDWLETEPT